MKLIHFTTLIDNYIILLDFSFYSVFSLCAELEMQVCSLFQKMKEVILNNTIEKAKLKEKFPEKKIDRENQVTYENDKSFRTYQRTNRKNQNPLQANSLNVFC